MTVHDKDVLTVAPSLLKKGASEIEIGPRVLSRHLIVKILSREFPDRVVVPVSGGGYTTTRSTWR